MARSDFDSNDPLFQLAVLQEKFRLSEETAREKFRVQEQVLERALADVSQREIDLKQATEEIKSLQDNSHKETSRLIDAHNREISELKDNHNQEISKLKDEHNQEISQLREAQAKETSRLSADHRRRINFALALSQKKISRLKVHHWRKINGLHTSYREEISGLRIELEVIRNDLMHARESLVRKNKITKFQAFIGSVLVFVASLFGSFGVNLLTSTPPNLLGWFWIAIAGVIAIAAACVPIFSTPREEER